jgi:hypothetical protein
MTAAEASKLMFRKPEIEEEEEDEEIEEGVRV